MLYASYFATCTSLYLDLTTCSSLKVISAISTFPTSKLFSFPLCFRPAPSPTLHQCLLLLLTPSTSPAIAGRFPAKFQSNYKLNSCSEILIVGFMDIDVAEGEAGELPCPRDLLRRFTGTTCSDKPPLISPETASYSSAVVSREMDLCLGLSLGGCFGREKRLVRSSSIAEISVVPTEEDYPPAAAPLARTCSLPVEAEEDHRKRKEMQSLKRLEAKRKREEKKGSRTGCEGEIYGGGVPPRWGMGGGVAAAVSTARPAGLWRSCSSFDVGGSRGPELPAMTNSAEAGKSSSSSSTPEIIHKSEPPASTIPPTEVLRSLRSLGEDDEAMKRMSARSVKVSKDVESNIMEEMPCVSTKGDGPNGTRIEGFLYKYKKGEEVRIVCVCHGRFLTPAEFIRHAGGGDVDHPLRHIVVNPPSSSSSSSAYYSQ